MNDTFLYVIAHKRGDEFIAPVKVGITKGDPMRRVKTLQTGSSVELGLVTALNYPDRGTARKMENMFHDTQAKHHIHGEWFDIEPKVAFQLVRFYFAVLLHVLDISEEDKRIYTAQADSYDPDSHPECGGRLYG